MFFFPKMRLVNGDICGKMYAANIQMHTTRGYPLVRSLLAANKTR